MTPSPSARRTSIGTVKTRTSAGNCWPSTRRSSGRCKRCCGRKAMLRISRCAAAIMLLAVPTFAAERFEKTIHAAVDYQGGRVTIDHRFGRVSVRTSNSDQVTARGIVRSSDAELGKQIRFAVMNGTGGVSIRTIFPEIHSHSGELSYSADLEVSIPERAPLFLRNRFGSVDVEGLRASSEIVNGQGAIRFRDSRGSQRIENSFGSITVQNSNGDTTVQNANGAVSISDVGGTLSVSNRFASVSVERVMKKVSIANGNGAVTVVDVKGPANINNSFATVELRNIGGTIDVTNQNGRVDASDINGAATIRNSFASIEARNIHGPATITSGNGNVSAIDIHGDLSVDTRFGLVKAEHVRGSLSVDNQNGGVTATDVTGDARVHTSFASVFLKDITGAVDVEDQNGGIAVSGLRGGCNTISLRTSFSSIKVALGSNASYTISARTSYGSINTDMPFTVTAKSSTDSTSTFSGTIGNGGCKMELNTSNGGITITRE